LVLARREPVLWVQGTAVSKLKGREGLEDPPKIKLPGAAKNCANVDDARKEDPSGDEPDGGVGVYKKAFSINDE
jgi:hypothetical protein